MPPALDRRFEAAVFDWDGTAVPDRQADAGELRACVEHLCRLGFDVAVVSGTHAGNVDGQLGARPRGPGRLHLCLNRGSEVFAADEGGLRLVLRREAGPEEDAALTAAAELAAVRLAERGLRTAIVAQRLNRRKIDLIPEPAWADPPKARIAELLAAVEERLRGAGFRYLREVVELARSAAVEAGVADPRVTSDVKHVEIGLTDKSDSARWILGDLWERGIGPGLVLVAGDEMGPVGGLPGSDSFLLVPEAARATAVSVGVEPVGVPEGVIALGGGPPAFAGLLRDQLRRREEREVPRIDEAPGWTLAVDGLDPQLERAHEALLTLADGRIGTSGTPVAAHPAITTGVLAAGVYAGDGPNTELLHCPIWNLLPCEIEASVGLRRVLDFHSGVQRQELATPEGALAGLLFSSLERPGTAALLAHGPAPLLEGDSRLVPPPGGRTTESGDAAGRRWMRASASRGVAAAASEVRADGSSSRTLERLVAYAADPARTPSPQTALRRLRAVEGAGFEALLAGHRRAWAKRWEEADVVVEGDPELQLAVRLALFHLMASVPASGEAAVGARGLSGPGYRGHVFWDADVFVLPFLAATHPPAARAMLEYRARRLPAARDAARSVGREGARFPWESAATGFDVTPPSALDRSGSIVPILTGELEEHITADVAWGAGCYSDWTGDRAFASGAGRALIVETARYWASRIRLDEEGRGHVDGVIGPDEYHEAVDDNAFTNVMARWNLRRAAAAPGVEEPERGRWLALAASLADGYDPATGLYEQFAGFFGLEPLVVADVAPRRPIAAEALLGRERVASAQVVKQADVLMLHHLVPGEVAPGSLLPNLLFYEPRTAHGSSLSPGIHAALFARARRLERALELVRLTSRIDLDDLTGTTAAGVHLATMGSLWQALVFGFLGLAPDGGRLRLDPVLPEEWRSLEARVRFRGRSVRVRAERGRVAVFADRPVRVSLGRLEVRAGPAGVRLELPDGGRRGAEA